MVGVAAVFLGLEHRDVGVADQRIHVGAVLGEQAHADAGRAEDLALADDEGLPETVEDLLGDDVGARLAVQVGQQHEELVAAQAGHGIAVAQHRAQSRRRGAQHRVPESVAVAVVDELEAVQVDEHEGGLPADAPGAHDGLFDAVADQGHVGKIRKAVVRAHVLDAQLVALALRDVLQDARDQNDGSVFGVPGIERGAEPACRTVEGMAAQFQRHGAAAGCHRLMGGGQARAVLGVDQLAQAREARRAFGRIAAEEPEQLLRPVRLVGAQVLLPAAQQGAGLGGDEARLAAPQVALGAGARRVAVEIVEGVGDVAGDLVEELEQGRVEEIPFVDIERDAAFNRAAAPERHHGPRLDAQRAGAPDPGLRRRISLDVIAHERTCLPDGGGHRAAAFGRQWRQRDVRAVDEARIGAGGGDGNRVALARQRNEGGGDMAQIDADPADLVIERRGCADPDDGLVGPRQRRVERDKAPLAPFAGEPGADVTGDLRGADDPAVGRADGRDRERDIDPGAVLAQALRFVARHALALLDALDDEPLLPHALGRQEHRDGSADDFVGGVSEEALGAGAPDANDAVEGLAHDGVLGRCDDGGQQRGRVVKRREDLAHRSAVPAGPAACAAHIRGAATPGGAACAVPRPVRARCRITGRVCADDGWIEHDAFTILC